MSSSSFTLGFRVVGPLDSPRRRVHYHAAFDAYRTCDPRAVDGGEAYLSAFCFDSSFGDYLSSHGTTKGFAGPTWAPAIRFDIDREVIDEAFADTRRLVDSLAEDHAVPIDCVLVFFSGRKGFHVDLPTGLWVPEAGIAFHKVAREFASRIAAMAGVRIDAGVYDAVRAFRAPNSRHPKTGLYKRVLPADRLGGMTADDCCMLAQKPHSFDWPKIDGSPDLLAALWDTAKADVVAQEHAATRRREEIKTGRTTAKVNDLTRRLLAGDPIATGERHVRVYSAAANLAELGVPLHAIQEILTEPALDTGLPPREVIRAIENGHARGAMS